MKVGVRGCRSHSHSHFHAISSIPPPGRPLASCAKGGTHGCAQDAMLTGEMHGLPLLQFVAVAMLILGNAFFVAAEFALVSIRDTRIEQMIAAGVPGARAVRRLQQDLDDFLPAVQLGVTLDRKSTRLNS